MDEQHQSGVQLDRVYPHEPDKLWEALTDSAALADWLLPNDFVPQIGRRFHFFRQRPGSRRREVIHCRVIEIDAPRRLAYTWRTAPDAQPELVSWTLDPVDQGTRLRLEHVTLTETMRITGSAALSPAAHVLHRLEIHLGAAQAPAVRQVVGRIRFSGAESQIGMQSAARPLLRIQRTTETDFAAVLSAGRSVKRFEAPAHTRPQAASRQHG